MTKPKLASLLGPKLLMAFLLLQASQGALAFTIIEIPDSSSAPGSSIAEASAFGNQLQPVVGALQDRLQDIRRHSRKIQSAQQGSVLAYNSHAQTMSDAEFIKVSAHGSGVDSSLKSLWFNSSFTAFDNDFSRTKYDGDTQMLIVGYDNTVNDRFTYGAAISYETSDIDTVFNGGNQEVDGFSINPYIAYLFSDTWSVDLSLGIGDFDIEQYRTVGGVNPAPPPLLVTNTVTSETSSSRGFLASNLVYGDLRGNWYLSGWLGLMVARKEQDGYTESDDTDVDSQRLDFERWSLGAEAAYASGMFETYLGLVFEKDDDIDKVEFSTGEQPDYDDETMLLSLGWRYFGDVLVANIEFSSRLLADDVNENTISTTLRLDL